MVFVDKQVSRPMRRGGYDEIEMTDKILDRRGAAQSLIVRLSSREWRRAWAAASRPWIVDAERLRGGRQYAVDVSSQ